MNDCCGDNIENTCLTGIDYSIVNILKEKFNNIQVDNIKQVITKELIDFLGIGQKVQYKNNFSVQKGTIEEIKED